MWELIEKTINSSQLQTTGRCPARQVDRFKCSDERWKKMTRVQGISENFPVHLGEWSICSENPQKKEHAGEMGHDTRSVNVGNLSRPPRFDLPAPVRPAATPGPPF